MRQILVDHARARVAEKRGGAGRKVPLEEAPELASDGDSGLLALDDALRKLAALDERKCRVVEMRSFAGMSVEETALALGVSEPTIKRETRMAHAWLRRELGMDP
jgi:RNA polymerase sigma-70 factor (ECF subfamily)